MLSEPDGSKAHYYRGQRKAVSIENSYRYGRLQFGGVWSGVDIEFSRTASGLQVTFSLRSASDLSKVRLGYESDAYVSGDPERTYVISIDENGANLGYSLATSAHEMRVSEWGTAFLLRSQTSEGNVMRMSPEGILQFSRTFTPAVSPSLAVAPDESLWFTKDNPDAADASLWKLDPNGNEPQLLNDHIPAGSFLESGTAGDLWVAVPSYSASPSQGSAATPLRPTPDAPLPSSRLSCGGILHLDASGTVLLSTFVPLSPDRVRVAEKQLFLSSSIPGSSLVVLDETKPAGPVLIGAVDATSPRASFGPGNVITIFGARIGPAVPVNRPVDKDGRLSTEVDGLRVRVAGIPVRILAATSDRITFIMPLSFVAGVGTSSTLVMERNGSAIASMPISFESYSYTILEGPDAPDGFGIFNEDGSINSVEHPAPPGSVVRFYVASAGPADPRTEGELIHSVLARPTIPDVRFGISLAPAEVISFTQAADQVSGIIEARVRLPQQFPGDASATAMPIVFFVNGVPRLDFEPHTVKVQR
jgi:uncharacterized protein (TIGR03437 family)